MCIVSLTLLNIIDIINNACIMLILYLFKDIEYCEEEKFHGKKNENDGR